MVSNPHRPVRVALVILVAALVLGAAAPAARGAGDDPAADLPAAEARMLDLIGADRNALGLIPFRGDQRLTQLARERSAEMAATVRFTHTTSTGGTVFDLLSTRGITWFAASEVIAWNDMPDGLGSADMAHAGWLGSAPHRAILRATDLNYLGVGAAYDPDTGARYWTAIAIRQPDRTGAIGRIRSLARTTGTAPAGSTRVAIAWTGYDVPLQVLTAGLRDFHLQRRVNGGPWRTIASGTTATRVVQTLQRGTSYEFRVRARDRRGNYGAWSTPRRIVP